MRHGWNKPKKLWRNPGKSQSDGNALHKTKKTQDDRIPELRPERRNKSMRTKNSTLKNVNGTEFNVNERMRKKVDESVHARIYVGQRVGGTYVHHSVCVCATWTRIGRAST